MHKKNYFRLICGLEKLSRDRTASNFAEKARNELFKLRHSKQFDS